MNVSVADGYQLKKYTIFYSLDKTKFEVYGRFLKIKTLEAWVINFIY